MYCKLGYRLLKGVLETGTLVDNRASTVVYKKRKTATSNSN